MIDCKRNKLINKYARSWSLGILSIGFVIHTGTNTLNNITNGYFTMIKYHRYKYI